MLSDSVAEIHFLALVKDILSRQCYWKFGRLAGLLREERQSRETNGEEDATLEGGFAFHYRVTTLTEVSKREDVSKRIDLELAKRQQFVEWGVAPLVCCWFRARRSVS